jgi:hypothetical protein
VTRLILIALVALAAVSTTAAADDPTEAEQRYDQGQAAFDANRFDDAVSAWERSYELSKQPALLFNLGQAYRQRRKPGDCARAREAYKKFRELDATSDKRTVAQGFATEMEKCAASETLVPPPTAAAPPMTNALEVEPRRDAPTNPERTTGIAGLAVAGGGAALLVTGIYFGHRASSLGDEVTKACATGCNWTDYAAKDADGRSDQNKQWIFAGIGAAAIVSGGVLYWLGSQEHTAVPIAITSHRDGAVITWSGSW